jgi:hypothetical protein
MTSARFGLVDLSPFCVPPVLYHSSSLGVNSKYLRLRLFLFELFVCPRRLVRLASLALLRSVSVNVTKMLVLFVTLLPI